METSEHRVFVDSNYLIAFFNLDDSLHQKAMEIGRRIKEDGTEFVASNFIFLETVTVLSQRAGKRVAWKAGQYLLEDPLVKLIPIDDELQKESWKIFQEIEDKDVSFVDSSILAAMRAEGVSTLLTFDSRHFKPLQKTHRFRLFNAPADLPQS